MHDKTIIRVARELTPVEQRRLEHLAEDHAGTYYGGPLNMGLADAVRYTAEAVVEKTFPDVACELLWAAVRRVLEQRPEILARGRLSDQDRANNAARRRLAADELIFKAESAFTAGDYDRCRELIDQAEMEDPTENWDRMRQFVDRQQQRKSSPSDTTTGGTK